MIYGEVVSHIYFSDKHNVNPRKQGVKISRNVVFDKTKKT